MRWVGGAGRVHRYLSLSMRDGQTAGRSLFAQSSSENRYDVAASACNAAMRP